jgi:RNA polymerase sigma-70 factor, ECF subfamily
MVLCFITALEKKTRKLWPHCSTGRYSKVKDPRTSELELIRAILGGDSDLYHELIRPHERTVYLTAYSLLRDEADAEDVAQEAILKAYRALATFRGASRFGTWLISIVCNEARGRLRKNARANIESYDAQVEVTPALLMDWREIPSELLERHELVEKIETAIKELPLAYREVFILRDRDELSIDEIAEALAITENLVKVRLHRARMMLQKCLAPYLKSALGTRPRRFPFSWGLR